MERIPVGNISPLSSEFDLTRELTNEIKMGPNISTDWFLVVETDLRQFLHQVINHRLQPRPEETEKWIWCVWAKMKSNLGRHLHRKFLLYLMALDRCSLEDYRSYCMKVDNGSGPERSRVQFPPGTGLFSPSILIKVSLNRSVKEVQHYCFSFYKINAKLCSLGQNKLNKPSLAP